MVWLRYCVFLSFDLNLVKAAVISFLCERPNESFVYIQVTRGVFVIVLSGPHFSSTNLRHLFPSFVENGFTHKEKITLYRTKNVKVEGTFSSSAQKL